jgi:hypothetical protein
MANIPLQYPFPYKTINSTGFTSSVEFVNVTVLGDVTIDQNLTVSGNITTTDLTVGDDLTVGGQIDAQVLRAFGVWDTPIQTVNGAGAWIGFDGSGHTIFANRKSTAGQTNSFRWHAYTETNAFQGELMRLSNAGNLFVSGTRIEFPLVHFNQPPGTFPFYDFILPSSMGGAGQVLTSAGVGNPTYWTTPSGGGGGGGGGTVTNVTGTSPVTVTSPSTTPNISLTTIPTTLGGTGLTTIGTNGQVLSSNGTNLQYVTLPTPVTSVSATSPLASSGGSTPTISIASSTGTGSVVLQTSANLRTPKIVGVPDAYVTIEAGTVGTPSLFNISTLFLDVVGGGGGLISQFIRSQYSGTYGYHTLIQCYDDFVVSSGRAIFSVSGNVGIGTTTPAQKLSVIGSGIFYNTTNVGIQFGNAAPRNYTIGVRGDTSNVFAITDDTAAAFRMVINTSGNVGIGTTTPAQKLDVNGTIQSTGFINNGSSFIKSSATDTLISITSGNGSFGSIEASNLANSAKKSLNLNAYGGNVGINTTTPGGFNVNLDVVGRIRSDGLTGDVGCIELKTGSYQNFIFTNGASGLFADVNTGGFVIRANETTSFNRVGGFLAPNNTGTRIYLDFGKATTLNNGCFLAYDSAGTSNAKFTIAHHGATGELTYGVNQVLSCPGNVGIGTTAPAQKLHVNNGRLRISDTNDAVIEVFTTSYSNYLYTKSSDGHFIIDVSSRNVGIGTTTPSTKLQVNGTVRATNFTTNGSNTFTYEHGNFTPRLMAYRRPTGLAYELSGSLPGPCSITASYSVQTGRYVKIGQSLTINLELRWTISTSGVGPDDYDIFVWIPDGFNPNAIAVAGPCLNFPNTIGGVSNPMGILAQYPSFNAGGNVCGLFPTTGTGQIAYPIFAPGGTQILQFTMTYVVN